MPHTIHQEVTLDADAGRVLEALTDAAQFAQLTGAPAARLSATEGERIELFGGHITGRNIEFVPSRRLVQAWRAASWPEGAYSIVKFDLDQSNGGGSTRLIFDHTGFPEEHHDDLAAGWHKMYWEPLNRYLSRAR
ncbi:MAG: SRPBCC domain-containing protein [Solirubrobacterales bacterium]|nr:SRPBCC domain-containing protein [Solirubrobacterales bacterium]